MVDVSEARLAPAFVRNPITLTPVQQVGDIYVKRDDLFTVGGVRGGKVRSCWSLMRGETKGVVTAGSRSSPQVNIVAQLAKAINIPCRVHIPSGELTPELRLAEKAGAEIVQHRPGYNSVIVARATADAKERGWLDIPFGMECNAAVVETSRQVDNLPFDSMKRLIIPVGGGMTFAGIITGLTRLSGGLHGRRMSFPILGISVGADPRKRLNRWCGFWDWGPKVKVISSGTDYHQDATETTLGGILLDPVYEAKCLPFLEPGDCLWAVGLRQCIAGTAL